MAEDKTYTPDQITTAARELREAAGSQDDDDNTAREQRETDQPEHHNYNGAHVLSLLSDEIRLLRERGFTDERIADLLTGFDIDVTAEDLAKV